MADPQARAATPAPAAESGPIAVVVPAGASYSPGGPKLLGLTLLERTVFSLVKAGARHVTFLGAVPEGLARSPVVERSTGLGLGPLAAADFPDEREPVLVVTEGVVFDPRLPAEARAAAPPGAAGVSVNAADGSWLGLGWLPARQLARLGEGEGFPAVAASVAAAVVGPGGRYAVLAGAPGGLRAARRALLQSVRKETDGFVSRNFNRYVSLQLTRAFIALRMTPNQISVIGLLCGLAGAALALRGDYWGLLAGAALYQLASILDGSDGEVAKLTGNMSDRGAWIDTACDEVASVAFFVALPIGLYRGSGSAVYLALGGFALVALALLYLTLIAYLRRTSSAGSMLQVLADVREAARQPGAYGAVSRLMLRLSPIVRRDLFTGLVFVVCLFGLGALAVWSIAVILAVAMAFLVWFTIRGKPRPAAG